MFAVRLFVIALCCVAIAAGAHAETIFYSGKFSGANESPPVNSPGTGTVWLTYSNVDLMLRIQTIFSGLAANDTVAHIHCCTSIGQPTAPVATMTPTFAGFPIGVTAGNYDQTFDMSQASSYNASFITANGGSVDSARAVLLAGLANGTAYFNIHSTSSPSGEIRAPLALDRIFGNGFD